MKLEKPAILVVDMLNDFITGALESDRARAIVPATVKLVNAARKSGVPVIFCCDAHRSGTDHELGLWGPHAIAGTKGAGIIPELEVSDKDYVVPKRRYSGFFQTELDMLLRELGVHTLVVAGVQTHICVLHTCADAFQLGYKLVVAGEATNAFTQEYYDNALAYIKMCYGADAVGNEALIASL